MRSSRAVTEYAEQFWFGLNVTPGRSAAFRYVMRAVLLALLVAATIACGSYRFPGQSPSGTGIVTGHVMEVPCAPVEPAMKPCASRPVPGVEIDFTGNAIDANTRTDANGNYSIELGAGTWKVGLKTYMRVISGPPTVTVTAGGRVVADYLLDSGIRVQVGAAPALQGTRLISLSGT